MIGVHHIAQIGENEKDQVLVTLAVDKWSKRYSRSKEELKEHFCWYGREQLLELLNDEVEMAEAIFKATYLEK